jgi:peroxin-6
MLKAISRRTRLVDENVKEVSRARGEEISTAYFFDHFATEEDANVVVREEDFFAAQSELIASVRYVPNSHDSGWWKLE